MANISLWKIKDGKREVWLDWCKYIMEHYAEASETLKEEQLVEERCVLFDRDGQSYLVYLHQPEEGKQKLPANMAHEMNQTHFKKMEECLERCTEKTEGYQVFAPGIKQLS